VEAEFPDGVGVGVRRPLLHDRLSACAREVGVALHWGTPVHAVTPAVLHCNGLSVAYRWLIAADGLNSVMRRRLGLNQVIMERCRRGFQRHYRVTPWSPYVEIHWSRHGQACITPVGPEEVCVCLITHDPRWRFDALFRLFPQVAARLHGAVPTTAVRGALTATRQLARVVRDHVALVGDASGSVDAITGDGLCLAFQQAERLGQALAAGDLAHYASAHRQLARRARCMAALLTLLDRRAWLRRRALRAFAAEPAVFASFLAFHVDQGSLSGVDWRTLLACGWRFVAG
jgi:flavin-dependent dehydrogenase